MIFFLPACLINISSLQLFLSLKEFLRYFLTNNLAVFCSCSVWFSPIEIDRDRELTQIVQHSAYSGSSQAHSVAKSLLVTLFIHGLAISLAYPNGERGIFLLCPWWLLTAFAAATGVGEGAPIDAIKEKTRWGFKNMVVFKYLCCQNNPARLHQNQSTSSPLSAAFLLSLDILVS